MSARAITRPWRTQPPSGYRFNRDSHLARLARFAHVFTPQSTVDLTGSGAALTPGPSFVGYRGGPYGLGWQSGAQAWATSLTVTGGATFNSGPEGFWVVQVLNNFTGVDGSGGILVGYNVGGNDGLGVASGNLTWYWYSGIRLSGPAVPVGVPSVVGGWYGDPDMRLFVNGQFASGSHGGVFAPTNVPLRNIAGRPGMSMLNGNVAAVFAGWGKPHDEFFLRMWENPWQVFEPRRIWVPVAAAGGGAATVALGGAGEREQAGSLAAAAGPAIVLPGGVIELERAGGAAVAAGIATASIGGGLEQESAGGAAAAPGAAPVSIGGAAEAQDAGGLSVAPGPATVAAGGSIEREAAGGVVAAVGITLDIGGAFEAERAGGASAAPGQATIAPGGYTEIELPGALAATQGIVVSVGGAEQRSAPGGLLAAPGVAQVFAGGAAEREATGGALLGTVSAVVLGNRAEGEIAGGFAVAAGPAQIAVGGADELQRIGGFSAQRIGADILAVGGCDDTEIAGALMALVAAQNSSRVYTVDAALRAYAVGPANRTAAVAPAIRG